MPARTRSNNTPMTRMSIIRALYYAYLHNSWVFLWNLSKIYIFWIVSHYIITNVYYNYCVPRSAFSVAFAPILMAAPHCRGMIWYLNVSSNTVYNMTYGAAGWLGMKLIITMQGNPRPIRRYASHHHYHGPDSRASQVPDNARNHHANHASRQARADPIPEAHAHPLNNID